MSRDATTGAPRRRRLLLGILAVLGVSALVAFYRRVFAIRQRPSWPPSPRAVTSAGARAATEGYDGGALEFAWSTAATIDPWVEGKTFFPRIFADVEAAASSVHILMFGWREGAIGTKMAELLRRKLAEGVEVRVAVDGFGSRPYAAAREMFAGLSSAGAEIVVNDFSLFERRGLYPDRQRRLLRRGELGRVDHRKLYVVDGTVAWTGGAGLEDHFENGAFHDVMVRVTGDVVLQAQAAFLTSFHARGGPLPADLAGVFPEQREPGRTPVALAQVIPGGEVAATQAIMEQLDGAKRRLDVANPYLTDREAIARVIAAAQRGAKVRVLVSEVSNNAQASAALRHRYAELAAAGVEVYELPGTVVHAKVVVADDLVSFGTVNLDAWALYRNWEIMLVVRSPELAELFEERLFEPDIVRAQAAVPAGTVRERVECWVADKFTFLL
jgi:cardiolipin synthase A/B